VLGRTRGKSIILAPGKSTGLSAWLPAYYKRGPNSGTVLTAFDPSSHAVEKIVL